MKNTPISSQFSKFRVPSETFRRLRSARNNNNSQRAVSRGSHRADLSRISSNRKTMGLSNSHRSRGAGSPEGVDIMEVFHQWYQNAGAISKNKIHSGFQSHRMSAEKLFNTTAFAD